MDIKYGINISEANYILSYITNTISFGIFQNILTFDEEIYEIKIPNNFPKDFEEIFASALRKNTHKYGLVVRKVNTNHYITYWIKKYISSSIGLPENDGIARKVKRI